MPVVVPATDGHHRDTRTQLPEGVGETIVLGAVVRHLQHLDWREPQARGDIRLRVGCQEDVGGTVRGKQHDRTLVGVLGRQAGPVRPYDAKHEPAEPEDLAGPRDDDGRTLHPGRFQGGAGVRALHAEPGMQDQLDAEPLEHVTCAADVVALRVGEHEGRKPQQARPA